MIVVAVVNRHEVQLILDPFRPKNPALALSLPFYVYLFGCLFLGVLAGGTAVWFNQGRWRKSARTYGRHARRWQAEADRLARERDEQVAREKKLISAGQ